MERPPCVPEKTVLGTRMSREYRQEIDRLIRIEYGETAELVLRFLGLCFGSVLLFLYTGWAIAWLWPLGFFVAQALYYGFLKTRNEICTESDCKIAAGLFLLILTSFLWMPAVMASQNDTVLVFAGSTLMATAMVFLVRRGDTAWPFVLGGVLVVCCMYLAVFWFRPFDGTDPVATWGVLIANLVLVGYLAQALLISRRSRLRAVAATERAMQEQKMSAVGALAGGVAHDFNNMLTAIIGNLELARELPDEEERQAVLNEAHNSAKRAEAVVKQLLIYSRKAPAFHTDMDINVAVARMMGLAQRLIPASVTVVLKSPQASLGVRVDDSQLMTALINLVVNAVDAMPEGGTLRIVTSLERAKTGNSMADGGVLPVGDYAVIRVCDTGMGISEQDLHKVVQPFYSTKPTGKGTGLGLPMVLGFARDHGGALQLVSSPSGTEAAVWLPCLGARA